MSVVIPKSARRSRRRGREEDPRVARSRAAVLEAARQLFLECGYVGTTMEAIAERAGLTKRTLYNNWADKETLFELIVADVLGFADAFVRELRDELRAGITASTVRVRLEGVGVRLALAIVRPEVVTLRRMLIGESRDFPKLAAEYFDRAPGQVLANLAAGMKALSRRGVLRVANARRAAGQFAYLVAGETLDKAVLVGTLPRRGEIVAVARDGVETFLARYGP